MLAYTVYGFSYPIGEMTLADRDWNLKRVDKQLREEARALKVK